MQVQLDKRYEIPHPAAASWAVLRDVRAVAACMPGAQITEAVDDTHFKGSVKSKVGPAQMTFNGDIELTALDADALRIEMVGKGADRQGSSAQLRLAAQIEAGADAASSVLVGTATVSVGGKLAQFGGRLIVPVADQMLAQFADNFRAAAAAQAALPAAAGPLPAPPPVGDPAAAAAPAPAALLPVRELNVFALVWAAIKEWFRGQRAVK